MSSFETYPDRTLVQMKILANQQRSEITRLREALQPFAGAQETNDAETMVADESPVTIRCHLGDVRRAYAALHPVR